MNIIKQALLYSFFFLLLFFEPEAIGPITFSQLWKIPFFIFLFVQVVIKKKGRKPFFIGWSYLRAGKHLFSGGLFFAPLADLIEFIRFMFFPMLFEYFKAKLKSISYVNQILFRAAQFVIISGVPFVFFGLQSRGRIIFETEDVNAYIGVFQGPHAASTTTAIALVVIISFLRDGINSMLSKIFNYSLLVFGSYLLFVTYVRTGYAMFAIGVFVLFFPKRFNLKQVLGGICVLLLLVLGFMYLLETNEFFYNRIFDIRDGRETAAGSGRLLFWKGTIDAWQNGNIVEMLLGYGMEGFKDELKRVSGFHFVAHNEFFNQLGVNGLLGVFILFGFLYSLFKYTWSHRFLPSYSLALATFFLYSSLMMTQGGMWFSVDFFMALIYVRLFKESEETVSIEKTEFISSNI